MEGERKELDYEALDALLPPMDPENSEMLLLSRSEAHLIRGMKFLVDKLTEEPGKYETMNELYACMNKYIAIQLKINPAYGEQSHEHSAQRP